ncbi:MAG: hypothetical protein GX862_08890 [Leucobacter sp.]|nr:hypothetical protein [Leucobacter sp.]
MRRRVLPILAVSLLAGAALTGCTTAGAANSSADLCVPGIGPGALRDSVRISGDNAETFRVGSLADADLLNSERSLTVAADDRSAVAGEGSIVTGTLAYVDAATSAVLRNSPEFMQGGGTEVFLASSGDVFSASLLCAAPGDVVSVVLSEQDSAGFNYMGGKLLLIAEITDVSGVAAEGRAQALPSGFPAVTTDADGRPGVVLPPQEAPADSRDAARIKGTGEVVAAEQIVIGNVLSVNWSGDVQQNTWQTMVMSFGSEEATQSRFRAALTGYPIGSQVVVIDAGEGGAVVHVVDILAAV